MLRFVVYVIGAVAAWCLAIVHTTMRRGTADTLHALFLVANDLDDRTCEDQRND